jgi:hypothetical protein
MEMISTRKDKRPADMDEVITRLELAKHVLLKTLNPAPATTPRDPDEDEFLDGDSHVDM